jgi:hypothetical protein
MAGNWILDRILGRGPDGSTTMARKRKRQTSKNDGTPDIPFTFISLLISFLGYIVNIRPKLGEYEQGFLDCILIVLTIFLSWYRLHLKWKK